MRVNLPEGCDTPAYCKDYDEFHKLFFSFVQMASDNTEEACAVVSSMRAMFHDYLALVVSGKMDPYLLSKEEIACNEKDFRELMCEINTILAEGGVPLEEDKGGRLRIDYDSLSKKVGDKDGQAKH